MFFEARRTELSTEQIAQRHASIYERKSCYPEDLARIRDLAYKLKLGRSPEDSLLLSLEKISPGFTSLPVARGLATIILEATLDCKLKTYDLLHKAVALHRSNGNLKPIEDKLAEVTAAEEIIRREKKIAEDKDNYATLVRVEAIKAVFSHK